MHSSRGVVLSSQKTMDTCNLMVGIFLVFHIGCHAILSDREPRCSKFDFEEKILEKMVRLEHETKLKMESISQVSVKVEADLVKMTDISNEVKGDLAKIQRKLEQKVSYSVYARWGRTVCAGNKSELIYKGYIAGGHYNKGSGANVLCLPEEPTWGNYDVAHWTGGHIYGTEFDVNSDASVKLFGENMNQQDLPCAVCETHFSVTYMFPGRSTCFPGWSLQYMGYLVSAHNSHPGNKKYECLDSAPESIPRSSSNDNQCILYVVEAMCGSLPCPPYQEGREIACVVCSK